MKNHGALPNIFYCHLLYNILPGFHYILFVYKLHIYIINCYSNSFQEMVHAKDPPSHYLNKLRTYLDPKASRSHRVSFFVQ